MTTQKGGRCDREEVTVGVRGRQSLPASCVTWLPCAGLGRSADVLQDPWGAFLRQARKLNGAL